jgi:ABC-type sulfate transport system substrate-binding protein
LLVKKGNPKHIFQVSDLIRGDVRLFLSNPETEKASYTAYRNTLKALASGQTANPDFLDEKIAQGQVFFGKRIHHREAPQAVTEGSADAAVVFYHLALRYLRIFQDLFDVVPLGGSVEKPEPLPGNVVGKTHMGLVGDGGVWGRRLISFLGSKQAMEIYRHHGLRPASG